MDYPELPDCLNRKLHPELNQTASPQLLARVKHPDRIVWPKARIERVMREKRAEAKRRRKQRIKEMRRKARQ